MQTLKIIFFKNKENNSDCSTKSLHRQQPNDYFDSLQWAKLDIAHLDVLSMIHDLLDFFRKGNQPNFTLVVIKFYYGLLKERTCTLP